MRPFADIGLVAILFLVIASRIPHPRTLALLSLESMLGALYVIAVQVDLRATAVLLRPTMILIFLVWVLEARGEISAQLSLLGVWIRLIGSVLVFGRSRRASGTTQRIASTVAEVAVSMASARQGGLIVLERQCDLGAHRRTGVQLDAAATPGVLFELFINRGPLHDGAVVIRGDRVVAAGVVLPLFEGFGGGNRYGFRHRAALGVTLETDAIAVVVSEERGVVSLCEHGRMVTSLTQPLLVRALVSLLGESRTLARWPGLVAPFRLAARVGRQLRHSAVPYKELKPRLAEAVVVVDATPHEAPNDGLSDSGDGAP